VTGRVASVRGHCGRGEEVGKYGSQSLTVERGQAAEEEVQQARRGRDSATVFELKRIYT